MNIFSDPQTFIGHRYRHAPLRVNRFHHWPDTSPPCPAGIQHTSCLEWSLLCTQMTYCTPWSQWLWPQLSAAWRAAWLQKNTRHTDYSRLSYFTLNDKTTAFKNKFLGFSFLNDSSVALCVHSCRLTAKLVYGTPTGHNAALTRCKNMRWGGYADRLHVRAERERRLQLQHSYIIVRGHGVVVWRQSYGLDVNRSGLWLLTAHQRRPNQGCPFFGVIDPKTRRGNHKWWCIFMKWDCCFLRTFLAFFQKPEQNIWSKTEKTENHFQARVQMCPNTDLLHDSTRGNVFYVTVCKVVKEAS